MPAMTAPDSSILSAPGAVGVPTAAGWSLTLGTAATAIAAAALLLLGGCASPGPASTLPAPRDAQALGLSEAATVAAGDAAPATAFPSDRWWTALGDPVLDRLIEQALAGQPQLAQLQARAERAAATVGIVQAGQGVQVDASGSLTRERYTENGLVPAPVAGSTRTSGLLRIGGAVELDFFGRHAAALGAALGQRRAAAADAQAARVLLSAQLSRGWVQLARLIEQHTVAEQLLVQRQSLLELTRQRVAAGLDTALEQRNAEATVPDARQQIEALDEQIVLQRHQLAVLAGLAPQALDGVRPALAAGTDLRPPARLGADLLAHRADISAARWRVEAATQDVAVARKAFYPDINLSAGAALSALSLDKLLEVGSRDLTVSPAIHLPIFDGGRLKASLSGREADARAAIAAYDGVVLDALREARDAVASLQSIERQQRAQGEALQAAEAAWDIARQRYRAGLATQLQVLGAETAVLAQRRAAVDLRARRLDGQVQLVRALGGGWQEAGAPASTAAAVGAAPTPAGAAAADADAARPPAPVPAVALARPTRG